MTSSIIRIPEPFAAPVANKPVFAVCEASATVATADVAKTVPHSFFIQQNAHRDDVIVAALRAIYKFPEGKE